MRISDVTIFPAIGIARVGNAPDEFFIGPEKPWETPEPSGGFKDDRCRVKRQASRFWLFDQKDRPVTTDRNEVSSIEWTVQLANKKPTTYDKERNNLKAWSNLNKQKASIKPASETVKGGNDRAVFEKKTVWLPNETNPSSGYLGNADVSLGEIRTDSNGRLIVLGGKGKSGAPVRSEASEIYHNTGWYDDVSDGTVTATVTTAGGSTYTSEAWVVVGPPKFAPGIDNMVTLYERLFDVMVDAGYATAPSTPSYTDHIYPVLQRAKEVHWVTNTAKQMHTGSIKGVMDAWEHPVDDQAVRKLIFDRLRNPFAFSVIDPWYEPSPAVRVSQGTTVTFEWLSDGHSVVVEDQPSGANMPDHRTTETLGFSFSHTFNTKGVYKYYSQPSVSPWGMKGAIVVGANVSANYGQWFTDQARGGTTDSFTGSTPDLTGKGTVKIGVGDRDRADMPRIEGTDGYLPLTHYKLFREWKNGNYKRDWKATYDDGPDPSSTVDPDGLNRAALENCTGGALHPGIEVGGLLDQLRDPKKVRNPIKQLPILDPQNYTGKFRIDHARLDPGDLTKYMAVPWQTDFYACGFADWWPAARPREVDPQSGGTDKSWDRDVPRKGPSQQGSSRNMVDNWHELGFVVEQEDRFVEIDRCVTTTPSITLLTPSIDFGTVPHGPMGSRTQRRAVVFEVNSPGSQVQLKITSKPTKYSNLTTPDIKKTVKQTGQDEVETVRFPVEYETRASQGSSNPATDTITVEQVNGNGKWTIDVTAATGSRERMAVSLVLDRSKGMSEDRGDGKKSKHASLVEAVGDFVDLMLDGDGMSLVPYNHKASTLQQFEEIGNGTGGTVTRGHVKSKLVDKRLDPAGSTSIGAGIVEGHNSLPGGSTYDQEALVVLTDGKENTSPYIAEKDHLINERIFSVGLGEPSNTSAPTLQNLSGNHGGYLLVTGKIGQEDKFVLKKYFLQILSGITNADVVLDPEGTLREGDEHRIPFRTTDVDNGLDVILLTSEPEAVDFRLETPLGNVIEPWRAHVDPAMRWVLSEGVTYYRISLPVEVSENHPEQHGQWNAILSLGGPRTEPDPDQAEDLDRIVGLRDDATRSAPVLTTEGEAHERRREEREPDRPPTPEAMEEGLRYNLLVHSYSDLEMDASLDQSGFDPGADLHLTASVTEATTPVEEASVWAEVTRPDGTTERVSLDADGDRYRGTVPTTGPGTYRMRVRARGQTSRGLAFQREQRVTGAVWHGGDHDAEQSAEGAGPEARERTRRRRLCETVQCLLGEDGALTDRVAEAGIEVEALRECVNRYCHGLDPERVEGTGGEEVLLPPDVVDGGTIGDVVDEVTESIEDLSGDPEIDE